MITEHPTQPADREVLDELASKVGEQFVGASDDAFVKQAPLYRYEIPRGIADAILRFVVEDRFPALILREVTHRFHHCGATPEFPSEDRTIANEMEIVQGLLVSSVARLHGYARQKSGRVFNDIIPTTTHAEIANSANGSKTAFPLHTEDAYHEYPPDLLSLLCIRNAERAETTLAYLKPGQVSREDFRTLNQPVFGAKANQGSKQEGDRVVKRPILTGSPEYPYMRLNLAAAPDLDAVSRAAFERLERHLAANQSSVALNPGDLLLVNNRRCLHGRGRFTPATHSDRRWLIRGLSRFDILTPAKEGDQVGGVVLA